MPATRLSVSFRLFGFLISLVFSALLARADYKGVVVLDAASGAVLHEDNADVVSPPASVTKLMTFLVVHDALAAGEVRLDTPITATAVDQSMGGTQVHLAAGETYPVEELLYALMIQSANDAAHALTQIAGGREAFVARMNARAKALGMTNTVYRSPHGLPPSSRKLDDGDLTSPRDQAILARELLTKTDVLRFSSLRTRPFGTGVRPEVLHMRNHNNLLRSVDGCDGLKTGYTRPAGFCLVATAQRGTKRVIVAILGSPDAKTRDRRVRDLIEESFAKIPDTSIFSGPPVPVAPIPVQPVAPVSPVPSPDDATPKVEFKMPGRR
jgi:D-alanyl-D-alanine carboxypeptidase